MTLPRLQLFELEDFAWFPRTIRDLATDYLHFMETRFELHKPVIPLLRQLLADPRMNQVVDLCSGGSGPILALYEALAAEGIEIQFTLTDKFPNLEAFAVLAARHPSAIRFVPHSVDAAAVPSGLPGVRTIFNAFHHFAPAAARAVLEDAVRARQPIAIFEIPERSLLMMLPFVFTPAYIWLATPFIRPFRWKRLLWTYLLPAIPLLCWWDGLVSQLRAYTVNEMLQITAGLDQYTWTAAQVPIRSKLGHVTYLVGVPR